MSTTLQNQDDLLVKSQINTSATAMHFLFELSAAKNTTLGETCTEI